WLLKKEQMVVSAIASTPQLPLQPPGEVPGLYNQSYQHGEQLCFRTFSWLPQLTYMFCYIASLRSVFILRLFPQ
ncbi:hypothetical protein, partial [Shigella flexneri]|uniref:hypothetical protein n=1 Tax=Shigella flexneri TaxID=623 RepID=UPI001F4DF25E